MGDYPTKFKPPKCCGEPMELKGSGGHIGTYAFQCSECKAVTMLENASKNLEEIENE